MALKPKSLSVPKVMQSRFEAITALTDRVAREHLNAEYAELARLAAAALSRKRPSPLSSGRETTWACGILYALGSANFLFDPSQTPHLRGQDLGGFFGVAASTAANQGKKVRDLLGMHPLDPNWCLASRMDDNPMIWMLSVDGMILDIRSAPREIQQQAYDKGLIPYIPADRG